MRQFLVDEIPHRQIEAIEDYLKKKTIPSGLEKLFWLEIPEELLSPIQYEHKDCGPHYLAIELGQDFLKFEFLVRSCRRLRCDCVQYVTQAQENFLLNFACNLINTVDLGG
jgi:hypothetical protein